MCWLQCPWHMCDITSHMNPMKEPNSMNYFRVDAGMDKETNV